MAGNRGRPQDKDEKEEEEEEAATVGEKLWEYAWAEPNNALASGVKSVKYHFSCPDILSPSLTTCDEILDADLIDRVNSFLSSCVHLMSS